MVKTIITAPCNAQNSVLLFRTKWLKLSNPLFVNKL